MAALSSTTARHESLSVGGMVGERDRRILRRATQKLRGTVPDWGDAVRALHEAVEELIPAGRVYFLGRSGRDAVVGSLVSGIGIVPGIDAIQLVVRSRTGSFDSLGRFGA